MLNISANATVKVYVEGDCIRVQCTDGGQCSLWYDDERFVYAINGPAVILVAYSEDSSCDGCHRTYFMAGGRCRRTDR